MINRLKSFVLDIRDRQRINIALTKGAIAMQNRNVVKTDPQSWEFSGFSQNGEDGVLHMLRSQLLRCNRYFAEIGSADGVENNTSWMAVAEKYHGLMIEGNSVLAERSRRLIQAANIGVRTESIFVTLSSVKAISEMLAVRDPDVFSLDIDGNDFYIAKALLDAGIRPKVWAVEYNSVYGPARALTVTYRDDFMIQSHSSELYYGVSIAGWRALFEARGYRFVTVDRNGVNAFFVDRALFDEQFLHGIESVAFAENVYQLNKFRMPSTQQFKLIEHLEFVEIAD